MHDAPSVSYPVGRSRWAGALAASLWLCGLAGALLWSAQPQVAFWRLALVWTAVAVAGVVALRTWWRTPRGVLAWDGSGWTWTPDGGHGVPGELQVALDAQRLVLVRFRAAGAHGWFWLDRGGGERWDELRRAVYSRAGPAAQPDAEPPAAKP
jgi:toxin CptA